ncbi:MAG TPA: polysaccharide deacetylase family protein [Acidimicrobiales bacterium]|nr:polysaccharide deacetylase family protein [Acidimicrobiales bacterium]
MGIENLAGAANVVLPRQPESPNLPMTWDQARSLERSGVTFGPHTVTHPILSHVSDEAAEYEIAESWRRLGQELDHPLPLFCYPNGRLVDFGGREIEIAKELGMNGTVTVDEARPTSISRQGTLTTCSGSAGSSFPKASWTPCSVSAASTVCSTGWRALRGRGEVSWRLLR